MAQTLALQPGEAGPSSFPSSLDFIGFDEVSENGSTQEAEAGEVYKPNGVSSGEQGRGTAEVASRHTSGREEAKSGDQSPRTNGKKRKKDDVPQVDNKTKKEKKRELARGTPWCVDVDFDSCLTSADVLHDELTAFANWISPTPIEHETRKMVIQLISRAIVNQWPDAEVRAFGSQNTQLYMPQGDIDLVVISDKMELQRRESVLRSMAACLRRNNLATDVQVIAKSKVPIVKFTCPYGKYKVDISINQTNGLDASQFVTRWLVECPAIRPLIMATKLLLGQRGMSEVFSGGLGSYSVICLVISHMQMHPKVQRGEIDPARNLGVLFLEMLELYGKNFGYDEVGICIAGRGNYYRKAARDWKDDRRPFMLSIEDPCDASNDISKGSFSILNVRQTLGGAFDIITADMCYRTAAKANSKKKKANHHRDEDEEAREALIHGARNGDSDKDPDSLLGNIIGVNRDVLKCRRDVIKLWESGTLQTKLGRPPSSREPQPIQPAPVQPTEKHHHMRTSTDHTRTKGSNGKPPLEVKIKGRSKPQAQTPRDNERKMAVAESTSRGVLSGSKGTASDPVVVLDDSGDSRLQQRKRDTAPSLSPLREQRDSSVEVIDKNGGDDDEVDAETRYRSQSKQKRRPGVSRLDEFARNAPRTFVADDSGSEVDGQDSDVDSPEEGEASESRDTKRRKVMNGNSDGAAKRARRREYWEKKGNSVGAISPDEDVSE